MKSRKLYIHLFSDFISAGAAWTIFYLFRKKIIESQKFGYEMPIYLDDNFFLALFLIPLFWLTIYIVSGYYKEILRKSRLNEIIITIGQSLFGVTVLFFLLILDDEIFQYSDYYKSYFFLFCVHVVLTLILRLLIVTDTVKKVHQRSIRFNTLMVGSNEKALKLYEELENQKNSSGYDFVGFVQVDNHIELLKPFMPYLGSSSNIKQIIKEYQVEEVIIAVESSEHNQIESILNNLDDEKVNIKIIPDMYDIMSGSVKMSSIFDAPLVEVKTKILPLWQEILKRMGDFILSAIAIILLLPILILMGIIIKLTSEGPIFYLQERVGKNGKPFRIIKFRSMCTDAEKNGPALSTENDSRVTPFGKFMRKYRFDELPNFFNVIKGDMSLVGPRPERQFYIDQIVTRAPHYKHLLKVKPGVTSWGQVKFGYAENVDEMIERLKYDILYIENMSLMVDIKILIYTVLIVLKGRGQ
jgi:exopolysaccharide biosynthesis polyprenyl glycosylphosphotransferase